MERPRETAAAKAGSALFTTKTSATHETTNHAIMIAVFAYIFGESRRARPLPSKYSCTATSRARENGPRPPNRGRRASKRDVTP